MRVDIGRAGEQRLNIAIIGTGISGLSAAWLLAQHHDVTVFEASDRVGGHSNTVEFETGAGSARVDTGFIVYNEVTYPNLTALFHHLGVPTARSDMSFAVSLNEGAFEYSGGTGLGLLAQPSNIFSARFWSMMRDILRFYKCAPRDLRHMGGVSLDDYLTRNGYGQSFRHDHLYPMASAIWSTPAMKVGTYPAASFVRFCCNHGLLNIWSRPIWRTVKGGSREYVARLIKGFAEKIHTSTPIALIKRSEGGVEIAAVNGQTYCFDEVVIATHANQAINMLADATPEERRILGAFGYSRNEAVLHTDAALMPKRRAAWSSWNYVASSSNPDPDRLVQPAITYWMNRLQPLKIAQPVFVTLNPHQPPAPRSIICREVYHHPIFNLETDRAQREIWSLQGVRNTWFCGAYFGSGFHEDGIQAGLAVAEDLGGFRRPWSVAQESARIFREPLTNPVGRPIDVGGIL